MCCFAIHVAKQFKIINTSAKNSKLFKNVWTFLLASSSLTIISLDILGSPSAHSLSLSTFRIDISARNFPLSLDTSSRHFGSHLSRHFTHPTFRLASSSLTIIMYKQEVISPPHSASCIPEGMRTSSSNHLMHYHLPMINV